MYCNMMGETNQKITIIFGYTLHGKIRVDCGWCMRVCMCVFFHGRYQKRTSKLRVLSFYSDGKTSDRY